MDENNNEKKEERGITFQSIIPYLGSFIIFLGVLRLTFFYDEFKIDIISYLEFTEIITSFFDILIILLSLIAMSTMFIIMNKIHLKENNKKLLTQILGSDSFWKRLKLYPLYYSNLLLNYLITIVALTLFYYKNTPFYVIIMCSGALLVGFVVEIIITEIKIKHHTLSSSKDSIILSSMMMLSIIVCVYTVELATQEANDIKEKKMYYGTTLYLDDSTKLVSDSTNYYIGKTQNFIFFYHEKAKTTDVYPMDRVKQLSFKENKK
jgi:hypothetical protein